MMRQNCDFATCVMLDKYEGLLWKLSFQHFNIQNPEGIQVHDLYQEAKIGLLEALFTYQESREVGLAHYVSICVESHIKSALRRCRGKAYRLLDSRFSLDMNVSEDNTLTLQEMVACENLEYNPSYQANLLEIESELHERLESLLPLEKEIYIYWNEGYPYKEIAQLLDCNEKRVDNVVQKIKRLALKY